VSILIIASEFVPYRSLPADYLYNLAVSFPKKQDIKVVTVNAKDSEQIDEKAQFEIVRVGGEKSKVRNLVGFSREASRLVKNNKIEHIIASTWEYAGTTATNISKKTGIPYSILAFDYEIRRCIGRRSMISRLNRVLDNAANVFVVSEYTSSLISKIGVNSSKIVPVYGGPGIDLNSPDLEFAEKLKEKYSIARNDAVLFSSGDLVEKQAFDILLWAVYLLVQKTVKFKLFIPARGSLREKLDLIITDLKLDEYVFHYEEKGEEKALFGICDIYLSLGRGSRHREETGIDLNIITAAASGKPVIVSKSGGLPELVENNKTGFVVPPLQPKEIFEKISILIKDKKKAQSMGKAGRELANKKFNWEKTVKRILKQI